MLSRILGTIWVILGVLWLVKPEILKNRLKRKMNRKMRLVIFGFVVMFGFLLLGSVIKAHGIIPKIIGVVGFILAIKGIMLITSKTSEKVLDWWANRSLVFFRIWALFVLIIGLMLVFAVQLPAS